MRYTLAELARLTATELVGEGTIEVSELASLARATESSLSFLSNDSRRHELEATNAAAVVVSKALSDDIACGLISDDPYRTYAELSVLFDE
ncbi:MAG: LpxD N-terminal domain-containing protein, partial [Litorivicinaceae bacterium]|nr:LpxD N-terminal domain-containing protein [Litorivicinaceae bacterium]